MAEWYLHYPSWIIDDGEPDLAIADVFDWRNVSIWTDGALSRAHQGIKRASPVQFFQYEVAGEISYISKDSFVMDIESLRVVGPSSILPTGCSKQDYVSGIVLLSLPLVTEFGPDLPVTPQRWQVHHIFADTTPYVRIGSRGFVLDQSRRSHQQTNSTSALPTHTYILQCEHAGPGDAVPIGRSGRLIKSSLFS